MRPVFFLLVLLPAGCGKPPTPTPAPLPKPETREPSPAPSRDGSAECPLSRTELLALGFPSDVQATDFGSSPDRKKFSVRSEALGAMLLLELQAYGGPADSLRAYAELRERRGQQKPGPEEEDRYGQKSFRIGREIAFVKGATLGQITVGAAPEREPKEEDLQKILQGAARLLSK